MIYSGWRRFGGKPRLSRESDQQRERKEVMMPMFLLLKLVSTRSLNLLAQLYVYCKCPSRVLTTSQSREFQAAKARIRAVALDDA